MKENEKVLNATNASNKKSQCTKEKYLERAKGKYLT